MKQEFKYIIGVDEAGRGPLAGPVAVGVAIIPTDFDWELIPGVGDSKAISEKKREGVFLQTAGLKKAGIIDYVVVLIGAATIDSEGIVPSITRAITEGLVGLQTQHIFSYTPSDVQVKLDGGLKAPAIYFQQETIIKGDAKEKVIGLASIMAKVTRDHYMQKIANQPAYKNYDFARHKGYGTIFHRSAIAKYGLSPEHRQSYCKNIKMC